MHIYIYIVADVDLEVVLDDSVTTNLLRMLVS